MGVQDVLDYTSQLDTNKAVGIDGISTKFIRVSPCMAVLSTKLINKSIFSSSFPDCWTAAIVTPVLKSPKNTSLTNFHPISVLSKLLERAVSDQIIAHFCKHNLFSEKQSGFHYGHSAQDVLLHVSDSF